MNKVFDFLDSKRINYITDFRKEMAYIGQYPKDIRISKNDIDFQKNDYPHTGKFYYSISWIEWNKTNMKHAQVYTFNEAKNIILDAMKELDMFKDGYQLKLF